MARLELAEFFGTFVMLLIGNGVVAQTVLSDGKLGGHLSIHLGWAAAVTTAVYMTGGVSAHLNPAVSLALVLFGGLPAKRLPSYALAQIVGALLGSSVVFAYL